MTGDNTFDWTLLDGLIAGAATRQKHVVMSFYIHWPHGQPNLSLPRYLIDVKNITIWPTLENGDSLDYQNADLQLAIRQFLTALGTRYDGDKRIAALHVSLIGFWYVQTQKVLASRCHRLLTQNPLQSLNQKGGNFIHQATIVI
jgi:hypothetical protein